MEQLIQPIADITQIIKANTPEHEPLYLEESSLCMSPAKKRQKINDDNIPDTNQTELSKILLETIGKCI